MVLGSREHPDHRPRRRVHLGDRALWPRSSEGKGTCVSLALIMSYRNAERTEVVLDTRMLHPVEERLFGVPAVGRLLARCFSGLLYLLVPSVFGFAAFIPATLLVHGDWALDVAGYATLAIGGAALLSLVAHIVGSAGYGCCGANYINTYHVRRIFWFLPPWPSEWRQRIGQ